MAPSPTSPSAHVHDVLDNMIRSLCGCDQRHFWDDMDQAALKKLFESIRPIWDLRPEAKGHANDNPEALSGARLYLAKRDAFVCNCAHAERYRFEVVKKESFSDKIHRVITHWQRGEPLTPPVFWCNFDNLLQGVAGHHRTMVAMLSNCEVLPFYSRELLHFDGISLASPDYLELSSWQPM